MFHPVFAEEVIRKTLSAAGYTASLWADGRAEYHALVLDTPYLPGQIWVSDGDGYLFYEPEGHDRGLWVRYYPDPDNGAVWHTIYRSQLTDLEADIKGMLSALAALESPASEALARQLADRRSRLDHVRAQQKLSTDPDVRASWHGPIAALLRQLERITLAVIVDNARPCNRR